MSTTKDNNYDPYSTPQPEEFFIEPEIEQEEEIEETSEKNLPSPKEENTEDNNFKKKYTKKKIIKKFVYKKGKKNDQNQEETNPKPEETSENPKEEPTNQQETDEKQSTNQSDESYLLMYSLVENSSNLMCVIENYTIIYMNQKGVELLGFMALEEVVGMSIFDMINPDFHNIFNEDLEKALYSQEPLVLDLKTADDKNINAQIKLNYIHNEDKLTFLFEATDITDWKKIENEKKQIEKELENSSFDDSLTGLASKNLFIDRLNMALARSTREAHGKPENSIDKVAVFLMNIDKLKPVEKALGYEAVEHVLRNIGARLASSFRSVDTIAREKGDSFWMALESVRTSEDAEVVARRTLGIMYEDITYKGNNLALGCSIGISLFPEHGTTARILMRNAQAALQEVKYSGGGFYRVYDEGIETENIVEEQE